MATSDRPIRQSVSLAPRLARRVRALARTKRTSTSRVIADLVETGLEAEEQERRRFLDLADSLTHSRDPQERERLKAELARMTFGG
jgi:metal-responsive CopG/Arc/MetJ family transcriptional regulator